MSIQGSSLHPLPRLVQIPRDLLLRIGFVILMTWPFVAAAVVLRTLIRTIL